MKDYHNIFAKVLLAKRYHARLLWEVENMKGIVNMTTDYFDKDIKVIIEINTVGKNYFCLMEIDNSIVFFIKEDIVTLRSLNQTVHEIASLINIYVRSRPFCIKKYSRGCYRLFDPNGFDYIGEYVTLKDAQHTSLKNYEY